jgi:2-dehydropantoate 2-reductase
MKIGVVGCGALGSYYGARLLQAGNRTVFLLRSDYDTVVREGVSIRSPAGDFHVRPDCVRSPEEAGVCDLILIGLKSTANAELHRLVAPLAGEHTTVLTLQNGLGNEEALAKFLPENQIMGGVAFVCLNRLAPGQIHHLDHGHILIGEHGRPSGERTGRIAAVFDAAGVRCAVTDNLARTRWEKLVWNIPFNGLGVASAAGYEAVRSGRVENSAPLGPCLTTDRLLADAQWAALVRALMTEVVAAAEKIGFELAPDVVQVNVDRTTSMGPYKPSTVLDFERGFPLETESIFFEPYRRAQAAGYPTPVLGNLCNVLGHLARNFTKSD